MKEELLLAILAAACAPGPPSDAGPMPQVKADWKPVMHYLDSVVARGAAPGAVLGVSHDGERFVYGTGRLGDMDAARPDGRTIYDLASLTKVVGLTSGFMLAVQEERVDLDAPVQRYVSAFAGPLKEKVTVRQLLSHAGGLPAWRPLFREVSTRTEAFALADTTPLETAPGSRDLYSDLGAIVLTQVLEEVYQQRIDSLLQQRVFGPLGLASLRYLPPPEWRPRIAPTEMDPWRGRVLRGEVHDENAAVMDGVSGHAGLFGSAEDLLGFAEWLLTQADALGGQSEGDFAGHSERSEESGSRTSTRDLDTTSNSSIPRSARDDSGAREDSGPPGRPTLRPAVLREFTTRQNLVSGSHRALGWDTPASGSSAGTLLSSHSIGHVGFTGTSLWIDFDHHVAIVLLSNRVHPTRNNPRWAPVRAAVADLVMATLFKDAQ